MRLDQIRRLQHQRRKEAERNAMKLDRIGMPVMVTKDDGHTVTTTLTALPWTLGDGSWVAKVEGISGGYCCSRIRPAGVQAGKAVSA